MSVIDVAEIPIEEGDEVIHNHLNAARNAAWAGDFRQYSKAWRKFRQSLPKGHKWKTLTPEHPSEPHMLRIAHSYSHAGAFKESNEAPHITKESLMANKKKILSATSLMEWSDGLPEMPSVLPDGTRLEVEATDDMYWQDIPGHADPSAQAGAEIDASEQPKQLPNKGAKEPKLPILKPKDDSVEDPPKVKLIGELPIIGAKKMEDGSVFYGDRIRLDEDFDLVESRRTDNMSDLEKAIYHGWHGKQALRKGDWHAAESKKHYMTGAVSSALKHGKMADRYGTSPNSETPAEQKKKAVAHSITPKSTLPPALRPKETAPEAKPFKKSLADKHLDRAVEIRAKLSDADREHYDNLVRSPGYEHDLNKEHGKFVAKKNRRATAAAIKASEVKPAADAAPVKATPPMLRKNPAAKEAASVQKFYKGKHEATETEKEQIMSESIMLNEETGDFEVSENMHILLDQMVAMMESVGYEVEEGVELVAFLEAVELAVAEDHDISEEKLAWLSKSLSAIAEAAECEGSDCEEEDDVNDNDSKPMVPKKPEAAKGVDAKLYGKEKPYKKGEGDDDSTAEKPYKKNS